MKSFCIVFPMEEFMVEKRKVSYDSEWNVCEAISWSFGKLGAQKALRWVSDENATTTSAIHEKEKKTSVHSTNVYTKSPI